jgi:hypothetical protein
MLVLLHFPSVSSKTSLVSRSTKRSSSPSMILHSLHLLPIVISQKTLNVLIRCSKNEMCQKPLISVPGSCLCPSNLIHHHSRTTKSSIVKRLLKGSAHFATFLLLPAFSLFTHLKLNVSEVVIKFDILRVRSVIITENEK